jgi:hypothetical protein
MLNITPYEDLITLFYDIFTYQYTDIITGELKLQYICPITINNTRIHVCIDVN